MGFSGGIGEFVENAKRNVPVLFVKSAERKNEGTEAGRG